MPMRSVGVVEKNVQTDDNFDIPVVLQAGVATDVLPDILNAKYSQPNLEVVSRYIQNIGANDVYYVMGVDCGGQAGPCHGKLSPGQQLNASDSGQKVSMLSPLGTTVATAVYLRRDNYNLVTRVQDPQMQGQ